MLSDHFLFYALVEIKVTGEQIFKTLNSFFFKHNLEQSKLASIITDRAAATTGKKSGIILRVKAFV